MDQNLFQRVVNAFVYDEVRPLVQHVDRSRGQVYGYRSIEIGKPSHRVEVLPLQA